MKTKRHENFSKSLSVNVANNNGDCISPISNNVTKCLFHTSRIYNYFLNVGTPILHIYKLYVSVLRLVITDETHRALFHKTSSVNCTVR